MLNKTQVIVVEAEATVAEGITPSRQEISTKSLWNIQTIVQSHLAIDNLLLGGGQAITIHRQRNLDRSKLLARINGCAIGGCSTATG